MKLPADCDDGQTKDRKIRLIESLSRYMISRHNMCCVLGKDTPPLIK